MRRFTRHVFVGFLSLSTAMTALGQGAPIEGTAQVMLTSPSVMPSVNQPYELELVVDLSGVTGKVGEDSTPAVLAAYQIAISFDPAVISFVEARGGDTEEFVLNPITTSPAQANQNGRVVIVASHASSTSPTGLVSGAYVAFRASAAATTTLNVEPLSLSTALQFCCGGIFGPESIPATGSSLVVAFTDKPPRRRPVRRPDTSQSSTSTDDTPD